VGRVGGAGTSTVPVAVGAFPIASNAWNRNGDKDIPVQVCGGLVIPSSDQGDWRHQEKCFTNHQIGSKKIWYGKPYS